MSNNIDKSKHFLHLLLSTSRLQALALLLTVTDEQIKVLTEIAYNLLQLPLTEKEKEIFQKRYKIFKKLSNKNTGKKSKYQLIKHYRKVILDTLLLFKHKLIEILE